MAEDRPTDARAVGEVMSDTRAGLVFSRSSVAMVITNPNIRDNPIVYINDAFATLTGYDRSAVIGRNCRFLQGKDTDAKAVDVLRRGIEAERDVSVDLLNYRSDGESFLNRLVITPIRDDDGSLAYFLGIQKRLTTEDGISMETAMRAQAAAEAERADTQLVEVQHRVKNHLSMIIGMIRMQSRASEAPREFATLSRRIESLQLLYEEMTRVPPDGNEDRIALGSYLTRVGNAVAHLDGRPGIRVNIDAVDLSAAIDSATRVGLLASELLTNALQHAFEGRDFGSVEMRMATLAQGGVRLTVSDDGVGMPSDEVWPNDDTLGGRIVGRLVDGLGGSLHVGRGAAGTVVVVDVPARGLRG
jgi:PAS domain S-box-containing protein